MGFFSRLFGSRPKPVTVLRTFAPPSLAQTASRVPIIEKAPRPILNADAQPVNHQFNSWRRNERATHELIGLLKGIIATGPVTEDGLLAVFRWIAANGEMEATWPVDEICKFAENITSKGYVDSSDCERATVFFRTLVQPRAVPIGDNPSTALPLTQPAPPLTFDGMLYVLTGKFDLGPRAACESEVTKRGGTCGRYITNHTNVLVIGSLGSRDWIETVYGRKIQDAMHHNENGARIVIVSEEHWARFL